MSDNVKVPVGLFEILELSDELEFLFVNNSLTFLINKLTWKYLRFCIEKGGFDAILGGMCKTTNMQCFAQKCIFSGELYLFAERRSETKHLPEVWIQKRKNKLYVLRKSGFPPSKW